MEISKFYIGKFEKINNIKVKGMDFGEIIDHWFLPKISAHLFTNFPKTVNLLIGILKHNYYSENMNSISSVDQTIWLMTY